MRKYLINILLSLTSIILFLGIAILVDKIFISPVPEPIIFPPNVKAYYHTCEFDFTAQINSIGIRDYEVGEKPDKEMRILVIGDSYTYGWGVGIDSTWVKLTESVFKKKGLLISIFNAGKGGAFSKEYVEIARKAIPVIKPDIVLVSFLQANDLWSAALHQKRITSPKAETSFSIRKWVENVFQKLYPNLVSRLKYKQKYFSIQENWKDESKQLLKSFNEAELLRYSSLNSEIKKYFEDGLLSPSVIYTSVKDFKCYSMLEDSSSTFVKGGAKQIINDLISIKEYALQNKCNLALLFIPDRVYVSKRDNAILKNKLLLDVEDNFVSSLIVDGVYKNIANSMSLPFLDCGNSFRQQADSSSLYYPYDGHLSYEGNKLVSEQVSTWLEQNYLSPQ
jgi:lysophospholipase L1-like esterase